MKLRKILPALLVAASAGLAACTTVDSPKPVAGLRGAMPIVAMQTSIEVDAPRGYVAMCERKPELCDPAGGRAEALTLAEISDAGAHMATSALADAAVLAGLSQDTSSAVLTPAGAAGDEAVTVAAVAVEPPKPALITDPSRQLLDTVNRRVNAKVRQQTDWDTYRVTEVWNRPIVAGGLLSGDCEDIAIEKRMQLLEAGVDPTAMSYAVVYRRDIGLHVLLIVSTNEGELALDSRSPYIEPWNKVPYTWVKRQVAANPGKWVMVLPPPARPTLPRQVAFLTDAD